MDILNKEKEIEMTQVKSVVVEGAAAPCVVAITKKEAAEMEKSAIKAAKELGVGKSKPKRASSKSAEPRAKRDPKPSSKQAIVNTLVKGVFEGRDPKEKVSKEFKQEIIQEIMTLCNMTKNGATTYLYNALKTL
jgi:hypothetical protein